MQKSERGLMRSVKQQKRKQKLFSLYNNNNIKCQRQVLVSHCQCFSILVLVTMRWNWDALNQTIVVTAANNKLYRQCLSKKGKYEFPLLTVAKAKRQR